MNVAFLIFNRPDCTSRVITEIRKAKPRNLFVIADGPRENNKADEIKCAQAREVVQKAVDWSCKLHWNRSETNLGCAERVASGLTWAFSIAEELIVLEDDCLPHPSFFPYCEELLARYRADSRIGQICGTPFVVSELTRDSSYVFSRYGPIWGWASWRRAWAQYDLKLNDWPSLRRVGDLASVIRTPAELRLRTKLYDTLRSAPPGTWDFQWGYAKLTQSMLSVIPCRNLIQNIGFGADATHTRGGKTKELPLLGVEPPLRHPEWILPDRAFDEMFSRSLTTVNLRSILGRLRARLRHAVSVSPPTRG